MVVAEKFRGGVLIFFRRRSLRELLEVAEFGDVLESSALGIGISKRRCLLCVTYINH